MQELIDELPADWQEFFAQQVRQDYWSGLEEFFESLPKDPPTYPPRRLVFNALRQTAAADVRVVILGQDPYHNEGQAHGLSFSVPEGVPLPPSLKNIYRELTDDLGVAPRKSGDLTHWAKQGVLLLNTVLTVEAHQAHSHRKRGWEKLTDALIAKLGTSNRPIAFVLWGKPAQNKRPLINEPPHLILESAHPSPLSARRGFFGSRPFSRINHWLASRGLGEIQWS